MMESEFLSKEAQLSHDPETTSLLSREWQVLGGGMLDGATKIVSTTASDLKKAAGDLAANPLGAAGDYASNHWQDALAGAAIAVAAPGKQLNRMLLAWSMKGVAISTFHAGLMAADRSVGIDEARNYYGNALSHEGTAFLSAMPATLAGGYAGRWSANALFGKNLGLSDMLPQRTASGEVLPAKVTLESLRSNLLDLKYAVDPKPVRLVFTDMDNTLVDFSTFEAKGIQKSLSAMTKQINAMGHSISESEVYKAIGSAMDVAKSHDYPWAVEVGLSKRLKVGESGGISVADFRSKIVEPFWKTMDAARAEHMKLYPGVESTLKELNARGVPVVIVSDAPAYAAIQRATDAGLDRYIQRLYALDYVKEPSGMSPDLLAFGRERVQRLMSTPNKFQEFRTVPISWEKPHANSFNELLKLYGDARGPLNPREAIMIGDSWLKDVGVAHEAGMSASWRKDSPTNALFAEYGTPPKHIDEILTTLREPPERRSAPGKPKVFYPPLEKAPHYGRLLEYMDPQADYAMLARRMAGSLKVLPPAQSVLGFNFVPGLNASDAKK